jgi:DHA1 family tetracycline resistance protein-like MFS transporter
MKRSPLAILFITIFIDLLGFGLILPLLPIYLTHYGGAPWVGGLLFASFSTMQFIFSPIWGRASDKHGRRPMILLSLIGSSFSYLMFGIAPNLAVLFIARVASGILTAASMPAAQAYIADVTPPEKRAGGMAMIGAAFGLGFAFGPVIGGFLSRFSVFGAPPLATPAFFASALAIANFVWAFFMLPESHHDRAVHHPGPQGVLEVFPTIAKVFKNPAINAELTVFAFANFAFTAVESCFSWLVILRFHHIMQRSAAQMWHKDSGLPFAHLPLEIRKALPGDVDWASLSHSGFEALPATIQRIMTEQAATAVTSGIYAIIGVTILLTQVAVMAGLARKVGENRLVKLGSLLLTGTLIGIALAPSLTVIRVLCAVFSIGNGMMSPSLSALITQSAGPRDRGMISGAQQGIGSLARIIAPPINNVLVGLSVAPLGCIPFISSAVLMTTAFILSLRLRPLVRPSAERRPRGEPAAADINT